jgi:RHS repeat-associated protein
MGYDERGNVISTINPEGEEVQFVYNSDGQLISSTDPLGQRIIQFEYDSEGNVVKTIDALGRVGQRRFDTANRLAEAINARGRSSQFNYDALDRVTQKVDPLGNMTEWAYDQNGNVLTVKDARGVTVQSNVYDARGRLASRQDSLAKQVSYTFDGKGNPISKRDQRGQIITYAYDAINRLTRVVYADGRATEYTYDIAGNLIRVSDSGAGEVLYAYDNLNRLISETTNRGIVSYTYNAIGSLIERRINGGDPAIYTYDKANRLKTITYRNRTVTNNYDKTGRLVSRTLPNGIVQEYAYNAASEPVSIAYKKTGGATIEQIAYTYDENGNPLARNRVGMGSIPETPFSATYDTANRMLTYNGQPLTYDDNGNLIQRQTPQGPINYTWDSQDRLISIQGPSGNATFKYDHIGRRIEKTVNGVTTAFLYDGPQAIAELQGSSIGATYLTELRIDEVLARFSSKGDRTLLADAMGSVLVLTDDSQNMQTVYGYSPHGEQALTGEPNENSLQYTGRENDNTGLYYYRARYYDASLKRFISQDPAGLRDGLNVYTYVQGKVLGLVDPFGLEGGGNCQIARWNGYYITGWDPCDAPRQRDPFGGPDRPAPPKQCPEQEPPPFPKLPPEPPPAPPPQWPGEVFFPPELRRIPDVEFNECMYDLFLHEVLAHVGFEITKMGAERVGWHGIARKIPYIAYVYSANSAAKGVAKCGVNAMIQNR